MTDPRIEGSLGDLHFRSSVRTSPPLRENSGNFWTGVAIFIGVALVYPFYSYKVHAQLAARDVSVALTEFTGQMDAMAADSQRQARLHARESAARASAQRQRGVVLSGTTRVGSDRVVIVQLGQAQLAESAATICRQAARSFGEPLSGERLRVQRHRGSQPAVDAGTIICD